MTAAGIQIETRMVELHVSTHGSTWQKKDKKITEELLQRYGASDAAGKFIRTILHPDTVATLNGPFTRAQAWVRETTLASPNGKGRHWVLVEDVQRIDDRLKEFEIEARQVFTDLRPTWDVEREKVRTLANGMFDDGKFPSFDEVVACYSIAWRWQPLTSPEAIQKCLADAADEIREKVIEELAADQRQAMADHRNEMLDRLAKPLNDLIAKIGKFEAGKAQVFRDSIIANIGDVAHVIEKLNNGYLKDATINQFIFDARKIAHIPVELLKGKEATEDRAWAKKKATTLAENMRKAMG